MKKVFIITRAIFRLLMLILVIWLSLSFVEIVAKNLSANPQYSSLNLIKNFCEWIATFSK